MRHSLDWHDCQFDEVLLGEDDEDGGPLKAGMKVLVPCSCGKTPLDNMQFMDGLAKEYQRTLEAVEPRRALFHWAPVGRRKQILRHGLVPGRRSTTCTSKFNVVCFADSPSWAWALSAEMKWTPNGQWDLWQTALDLLTDPIILPGENRASGIYEVRTEHRVYKRDIWYVGSRIKP